MLIGAGPFAQKTYIPYLRSLEEAGRVRLMVIVEVHGMEDTVREVTRHEFPDIHLFFVPAFTSSIPWVAYNRLPEVVAQLHIDWVIISTESLAHTAYGLWAL